ncbi:acyl carrier protein [Patescibacteria group bacterium]|nr:acyl carrier protein [Patescibacteria group bacterium]
MKKSKFIEKIKEALEIDSNEKITEDSGLRDLEEYDSLGVLTIIMMIDENFGKQLSSSDFEKITTVGSLMKLIGEENFE